MKNKLIVTLAVLLLVSFLYGNYRFWVKTKPQSVEQTDTHEVLASYTMSEYGVQFSFPEKYFLATEKTGTDDSFAYLVVLAENTPEVREIFSNPDIGTESPVSMSVTIFDNTVTSHSAQQFLEQNALSNFSLSDGVTSELQVGSETGIRYKATGLYENENVVVARPEYVYLFTVYYNAPTDTVLADFETMLSSVTFLAPEASLDIPPEPTGFSELGE